MSPIEFLANAIKFGGVKRNYFEHGNANPEDVKWLIEVTDKLFEGYQSQVEQEKRLLQEIKELRDQLGRGDRF